MNTMIFSVSASTANVEVTGEILATVIDVDIPTTASFIINPNLPESNPGRYTMPTLPIINNTTAPVTLTMTGFDNKVGSENQFTEVAQNAKDWERLGASESKNYIYLAITAANDQAAFLNHTMLLSQASADQVQVEDKELCHIKAGGNVALDLECQSGSAFPNQLTSVYELTFVVSLYQGLEVTVESEEPEVPKAPEEPVVQPVGQITNVVISGTSSTLNFTSDSKHYIDTAMPQKATFTITTSTPDFNYYINGVKYTGSQTVTVNTTYQAAFNGYFVPLVHMYDGVQRTIGYVFY